MTKRARLLYAATVLVGIVALALATTWALVAIGEGTTTIKMKERGVEFVFGGTFGLFVGLIAVFVKTFDTIFKIVSVVIIAGVLVFFAGMGGGGSGGRVLLAAPSLIFKWIGISIIVAGVIIMILWFVLNRSRNRIWE
jgi:hypothetical protein